MVGWKPLFPNDPPMVSAHHNAYIFPPLPLAAIRPIFITQKIAATKRKSGMKEGWSSSFDQLA